MLNKSYSFYGQVWFVISKIHNSEKSQNKKKPYQSWASLLRGQLCLL